MLAGSNVTFILKEPSGALHYELVNSCIEPINTSHDFTFCPNSQYKSSVEEFFNDDLGGFSCSSNRRREFSIKNNCKTPYCTKMMTGWSPLKDETLQVLGFVTIDLEHFDPIVDADLVDQNLEAPNEETEYSDDLF
jgi:hypothetical protein